MKLITLSVFLFAAGGCLPPQDGCRPNATTCMNDRPYACSGTERWTPVGDISCIEAGGVCCMTSDGVHACVPQAACTGE